MAFISAFHIRFNSAFYQIKFFETNAQDPADPTKPWIQDPSWFLPIFIGFESFHQRYPLSYKTLQHGQSGAIHKSTVDNHVLLELTFKDKTPQGIEHVYSRETSEAPLHAKE